MYLVEFNSNPPPIRFSRKAFQNFNAHITLELKNK